MAHVLLVEDNAPLRQLLAEFLEAAGHQLESASDGAEALARLRQHRPDAVVLDLQLPAVDGWTFLRTCRATSGLADLPVVVMSALEDAGMTVAGLGVRCCLSKPFDLDQLAAALEQIELACAAAVQPCTSCGTDAPTRELRVFARQRPEECWRLCDRCWQFLEIGFQAHHPAEELERRLAEPIRVHAAEARGWIEAGLAQLRRRPRSRSTESQGMMPVGPVPQRLTPGRQASP